MSILQNQDERRRSVFLLTVAGLNVRYYSGSIAPATKAIPGTSINYTDRRGISFVGSATDTLDPKGGISENGTVQVELSTSIDIRDIYDPGQVFSRLTKKSASWWGQLIEALPQASGGGHVVKVDRDPTGLSMPRMLQVGAETMWATGTAGDGSSGNPWRFTGVTRAAAGSQAQVHSVDLLKGFQPLVIVDEVVVWRGRRATLEMAQVRPNGTLSEWVEITKGFFDQSPAVDSEGLAVSVGIVPLTALLENTLSNTSVVTALKSGYHYFEYPLASTFEHAQISGAQGSPVFRMSALVNSPAAGGVVIGPENSTVAHAGIFDPTLGDHPRSGRLWHRMGQGAIQVTGYTVPSASAGAPYEDFDVFAADPQRTIYIGQDVESLPATEVVPANVVSGPPGTKTVVRWPEAAVDAIESEWAPNDHTGLSGTWMNVRLNLNGNNGPELLASYNIASWGSWMTLGFWSDPNAFPYAVDTFPQYSQGVSSWREGVPAPPRDVYRLLWYPVSFAKPDETRWPPQELLKGRPSSALQRRDRDTALNWFRSEGLLQPPNDGVNDPPEQAIPIRGVAEGFYQTGEKYILVEDEVVVPSSGYHNLLATYWDGAQTREHSFRVVSATQVFDPDTAADAGWALEIDERDVLDMPSMGNWPGQEQTGIRSNISFIGKKPGTVLLELLLSGGGNGINSATYDVLPIGANLKESDIDIASFERFPVVDGMELWTLSYPDGAELRSVIEDMLISLGAAIVSRIDPETGANRLTLVAVGPENPMEALTAPANLTASANVSRQILEGGWAMDQVPTWETNDTITNKYEFKTNFTVGAGGDEDSSVTITVFDQPSITAHGEGETLSLDLRGVVLDASNLREAEAATQSLYQRLMVQLGDPRRTWRGGVDTGSMVFGHLGAVYLVTSRFLRGYGDQGVTGLTTDGTNTVLSAGRIISITKDYWGEGAEVVLHHYGLNGTGFAASATVDTTPSATSVTVEANDYTPTEHPVDGSAWKDIFGFFATQEVFAFDPANRDGASSLTIQSVDTATNTIVFTGAHGLSAGDIIIPQDYDQTVIRLFAYLADANETLGAAGDPAKEIT